MLLYTKTHLLMKPKRFVLKILGARPTWNRAAAFLASKRRKLVEQEMVLRSEGEVKSPPPLPWNQTLSFERDTNIRYAFIYLKPPMVR